MISFCSLFEFSTKSDTCELVDDVSPKEDSPLVSRTSDLASFVKSEPKNELTFIKQTSIEQIQSEQQQEYEVDNFDYTFFLGLTGIKLFEMAFLIFM
jgi:hypothetical protein